MIDVDFAPPFEIIGRACDGPDSESAQVRLSDAKKINDKIVADLREGMAAMFEEQFGHAPARIGVAVLPWVEEEDDPA